MRFGCFDALGERDKSTLTPFPAAATAAVQVPGQEVWAVGAYWEAGRAYAAGVPNIQAFAYRNALKAAIQYYGTLDPERARSYLPLTAQQRAAKINPLEIMEQALRRCNEHHQPNPGPSNESRLATNRQMAAVFHDFALTLSRVGNAREAGIFRAAEKERTRQIYQGERRYLSAAFYQLWRVTADYGESLGRWMATCGAALVLFAVLYYAFGLIAPAGHAFDYIYFSIVTFTTLGYGDIHPMGFLGELLASLEVALGFVMFGILLAIILNRFQRM